MLRTGQVKSLDDSGTLVDIHPLPFFHSLVHDSVILSKQIQ